MFRVLNHIWYQNEYFLNFIQVSKFHETNRAQALDLEGAIRILDGNLNHNGGSSNLTSTQPILVINAAQILSVLQTKCLYLLHRPPFLLPILAHWPSLKYASIPCITEEGGDTVNLIKIQILLVACNSMNLANVCLHRRQYASSSIHNIHHLKKLF